MRAAYCRIDKDNYYIGHTDKYEYGLFFAPIPILKEGSKALWTGRAWKIVRSITRSSVETETLPASSITEDSDSLYVQSEEFDNSDSAELIHLFTKEKNELDIEILKVIEKNEKVPEEWLEYTKKLKSYILYCQTNAVHYEQITEVSEIRPELLNSGLDSELIDNNLAREKQLKTSNFINNEFLFSLMYIDEENVKEHLTEEEQTIFYKYAPEILANNMTYSPQFARYNKDNPDEFVYAGNNNDFRELLINIKNTTRMYSEVSESEIDDFFDKLQSNQDEIEQKIIDAFKNHFSEKIVSSKVSTMSSRTTSNVPIPAGLLEHDETPPTRDAVNPYIRSFQFEDMLLYFELENPLSSPLYDINKMFFDACKKDNKSYRQAASQISFIDTELEPPEDGDIDPDQQSVVEVPESNQSFIEVSKLIKHTTLSKGHVEEFLADYHKYIKSYDYKYINSIIALDRYLRDETLFYETHPELCTNEDWEEVKVRNFEILFPGYQPIKVLTSKYLETPELIRSLDKEQEQIPDGLQPHMI